MSLKRKEMNAAHYQEETQRETAGSLGRSGRRVEEALSRLKAAEGPSDERDRRLKAAVEAVYYFFIQRELLGSPNHAEAIALYDIPDEVLRRLGSL